MTYEHDFNLHNSGCWNSQSKFSSSLQASSKANKERWLNSLRWELVSFQDRVQCSFRKEGTSFALAQAMDQGLTNSFHEVKVFIYFLRQNPWKAFAVCDNTIRDLVLSHITAKLSERWYIRALSTGTSTENKSSWNMQVFAVCFVPCAIYSLSCETALLLLVVMWDAEISCSQSHSTLEGLVWQLRAGPGHSPDLPGPWCSCSFGRSALLQPL